MSDKFRCNQCGGKTRHTVHHEQTFTREDEVDPKYPPFVEEVTYKICECAGCGEVTIVTETISDGSNGEVQVDFFPPRAPRRRPTWLSDFLLQNLFGKDPKYAFFKEIYDALDVGSLRLAVLGIRSLVEHIMIEQNGTDHGAFQKNLDAFEADGHISKAQKRSLMKVIELGHSVTHRAHAPSQAQITAALDVTESVIQAIYVDTKRIEKALQNLPPRRK